MRKTAKIFFVLMCIGLISQGHEFWIGLSNYRVAANGNVAVQFYVGEDFKEEVWAARKSRTGKVIHFSNNRQTDITNKFIPDSLPVALTNLVLGTHMITMESKPSYIEMKADKFNEYLAEDGIDDIAVLRKQKNQLSKDSREFYQRFAKTIFQSGAVVDSTYKIITGMRLELIPGKNPYSLKAGNKLPMLILFNGKPLHNYKIRTWNKIKGKLYTGTLITDNDGSVNVPLNHTGEWMISLVKMTENEIKDEADYTSYWGSLTFGL